MAFTKITQDDVNRYPGVLGLDDTPNLSRQGMQEKFEETSRQVIIPKHNELIDELESPEGASNIGSARGNVQKVLDDTSEQVNKFAAKITELTGSVEQVAVSSHTHDNKELLDTYTESNEDIAEAVRNKHTHSNKEVLDELSVENGKVKYGGKATVDSFSKVKVGSVTLEANEEDTVELIAGENVTLTPDKETNTITVSSTGGGGGGTGDGDMTKAEFVLPGGSGQVLSAKTSDALKKTNGEVITTEEIIADIEEVNTEVGKVNSDVEAINTKLDNNDDYLKGENRFDKSKALLKCRLSSNGEILTDQNDYFVSGKINVQVGEQLTISPWTVGGLRVSFYDSQDGQTGATVSRYGFEIPRNTSYMRFEGLMSEIDITQLESGGTVTPFKPYRLSNVDMTTRLSHVDADGLVEADAIKTNGDVLGNSDISAKLSDNADWLKSENLFDESQKVLGQWSSERVFYERTNKITNTNNYADGIRITQGKEITILAKGLDEGTAIILDNNGNVIRNYANAWNKLPFTFESVDGILLFTLRKSDDSNLSTSTNYGIEVHQGYSRSNVDMTKELANKTGFTKIASATVVTSDISKYEYTTEFDCMMCGWIKSTSASANYIQLNGSQILGVANQTYYVSLPLKKGIRVNTRSGSGFTHDLRFFPLD